MCLQPEGGNQAWKGLSLNFVCEHDSMCIVGAPVELCDVAHKNSRRQEQ